MRRFTLLPMLAALALAPAPAAAQNAAEAEVMVLGVYHFAGGQDYINPEVDDHLSPARQAEIAEVLDRLEAWGPARIMVELEPQHEAAFNARYAAFRAGEAALGVNERDQLGMALAARLGHERLYAVDHLTGMDFQAMIAAAQAAGQHDLLAAFQTGMGEVQAAMDAAAQGTVRQRLALMNSPEYEALHRHYLALARMGDPANPEGARQMAAWWGRNMIIYARIAQQTRPGDRVLVIFGSGHKPLLERYFDEADGFRLADPYQLLR